MRKTCRKCGDPLDCPNPKIRVCEECADILGRRALKATLDQLTVEELTIERLNVAYEVLLQMYEQQRIAAPHLIRHSLLLPVERLRQQSALMRVLLMIGEWSERYSLTLREP